MGVHWHAYAWNGRERLESKSFEDELPPMEIKYWLRKPRRLIRGTFTEPEAAIEWLAAQLTETPYRESAGLSLDQRLDFARGQLSRGSDVIHGYYPPGVSYASRALIACPRTHEGIACPEGR